MLISLLREVESIQPHVTEGKEQDFLKQLWLILAI